MATTTPAPWPVAVMRATPVRAPHPVPGFAPGMPVLQHHREPRQLSLDLRPRRG